MLMLRLRSRLARTTVRPIAAMQHHQCRSVQQSTSEPHACSDANAAGPVNTSPWALLQPPSPPAAAASAPSKLSLIHI